MRQLLKLIAFLQKTPHSSFTLMISHSNVLTEVGGTEKFQREDMDTCIAHGHAFLQIFPEFIRKRIWFIRYKLPRFGIHYNNTPFLSGLTPFTAALAFLILARSQKITTLCFHSIAHWNPTFLKKLLSRYKTTPLLVYTHDFSFLCQSYHLQFNGTDYCGALESPITPHEKCSQCRYGTSIKPWQSFFQSLFNQAQSIICPSDLIASAIKTYYANRCPEVEHKIKVFPHQQMLSPIEFRENPNNKPLKLAFLGNSIFHKGWDVFLKLSQNPQLQADYGFYHVGRRLKSSDVPNVTLLHCPGETVDSSAIVNVLFENDIDFVLLWSLVPESYSYTLYEAVAAGIPVLTNPLSGNIAAQILNGGIPGHCFQDEAALISFLKTAPPLVTSEKRAKRHLSHHSFLLAYLQQQTQAKEDSPPIHSARI